MVFEAFSFSSIRASLLTGAHSDEDHHRLKLELQPTNIIDSLGINNFCFYINKSFGLLKEDFGKIVRALRKKSINFDVNENVLKVLDDFYVIKFTQGQELISYFQNISMNRSNPRPGNSRSQLLRECLVSDIAKCKAIIGDISVMCLDIEIQTNHDYKPTEFGFVFYKNGVEEYHHYLIEEYYHLKAETNSYLQKKFQFGDTKIIPYTQFVEILQEYLERTDLFLAHSANSENHYLHEAGIALPYYVDYIVDTQFIYKNFDSTHTKPVSLQDMLSNLDIPHKFLHNAGNDAAYTWSAFKKMIGI